MRRVPTAVSRFGGWGLLGVWVQEFCVWLLAIRVRMAWAAFWVSWSGVVGVSVVSAVVRCVGRFWRVVCVAMACCAM